MSIWKTVFKELVKGGIDAYPPATKKGECKSSYVVVKQDGKAQVRSFSSEFVYYLFLLYIPQNQYSEMDEYESQLRQIVDDALYPLLMPVSSTIPDYYDDEVKGHVRSVMYRNCVRNKHL